MFKKLHNNESGITALETAIILIAFIVVASVFAFTILQAGTYSTERGKEAVFSGLAEVQSSMELKGSVIALASSTGVTGTVDSIIFTVGNVIGGEPIDLNDGSGAASKVVTIDYLDDTQFVTNLNWTVNWIVSNDGDDLLDSGELAQLTIPVTATTTLNATGLPVNTIFSLELKPPAGAGLSLQRTTPAYIDAVMDLQ